MRSTRRYGDPGGLTARSTCMPPICWGGWRFCVSIAALCRESAMSALRRTFPRAILTSGSIPTEHLLALTVKMDDFIEALKGIEPSAAREVAVELTRTTWDDVGGLAEIKRTLTETIEWPLRYPDIYSAMDLDPSRGVLLSGPP